MGFCSKNEIDKFGYNDCVITKAQITDSEINLELEALIVKAANSQNTNFTDSYAGEAVCVLQEAGIDLVTKAGYRYYDANDNLIEEKPDEVVKLTDAELSELISDTYLADIEKNDDGTYNLVSEEIKEDISENAEIYVIKVSCKDIIISWERYMNRVQN